jgi:hypothetical protein
VKYRLYVDEVGNPGLSASLQHPNERFLSLTGVIIELGHVDAKYLRGPNGTLEGWGCKWLP